MLSLQLKTGEYITIGDEVVVQLNQVSGDRCKVMVQAPREMTILRGEVLERSGGERPECVVDAPLRHRQEIFWSRSKSRVLVSMRALLGQMDGTDGDVRTLRRQLDYLFPPEFASNETVYAPK